MISLGMIHFSVYSTVTFFIVDFGTFICGMAIKLRLLFLYRNGIW